jgi:cell division inhibitor SepF
MNIIDTISRTFGLSNEGEEKKIDNSDNENPQDLNSEQQEKPAQDSGSHNVLSFNSSASNRENANSDKQIVKSKITTIKPKDFNGAQIVADCLRDKIPVIVNFEETDINDARRIIDFISGTTYAVGGKIKQVSQKVFICAPDNVTVSSSEEDKKPGMNFLD